MTSFLSRFGALVLFTLSGFDRLRLCGESRLLKHTRGVQSSCHQRRLRFTQFPAHAEALTKTLRDQTKKDRGTVPLQYLNSPDLDKEAAALHLAQQHGRTQGRLAVLTCQEFGLTYRLRKNRDGLVEPRKEKTRCLHYYPLLPARTTRSVLRPHPVLVPVLRSRRTQRPALAGPATA